MFLCFLLTRWDWIYYWGEKTITQRNVDMITLNLSYQRYKIIVFHITNKKNCDCVPNVCSINTDNCFCHKMK
jgi:hypothetical protein